MVIPDTDFEDFIVRFFEKKYFILLRYPGKVVYNPNKKNLITTDDILFLNMKKLFLKKELMINMKLGLINLMIQMTV